MQRVAFKEDHRARRSGRGIQPRLRGQPFQHAGRGHADLLLFQAGLVVVVRRFALTCDKATVRTGDQHQGTVQRRIVGQQDRGRHRPHPRHPVLGMPGFEIGMPIELFAGEARLIVQPALVQVNLVAQQESRGIGQPVIAGQPGEHVAVVIQPKDGADGIRARFGHQILGPDGRGIGTDLGRSLDQLRHFVRAEQVASHQIALFLVMIGLVAGDRRVFGPVRPQDGVLPFGDPLFIGQAGRIKVLPLELLLWVHDIHDVSPPLKLGSASCPQGGREHDQPTRRQGPRSGPGD